MASQNILNYYGSKLDIRVDYSELFDYQLSPVQGDYDTEVINFNTPITYSSLKINESMSGYSCNINTISINEFDYRTYDSGYIYSGLSFTIDYANWINYFDTFGGLSYENTILNNDTFTFIGITGEVHYFIISNYNDSLFIDPLLSGFTESEIISGFTPSIFACPLGISQFINPPFFAESNKTPWTDSQYFTGNVNYPQSKWFYGESSFAVVSGWTLTGSTPDFPIEPFTATTYYSGACCPQPDALNVKPWAYEFNTGSGDDFCDPILERRTQSGWTLDFVFNRMGLDWSQGRTFYYFGVRGEDDISKYVDNNLSFQFTPEGKIRWVSVRYSGDCDTTNGYSYDYYVDTDETPTICSSGLTTDFNISIVFNRYNHYDYCDVNNRGGWNDMISGKTLINDPNAIISGQTEKYELIENLDLKWWNGLQDRMGELKIYLNGNPIYKKQNWIEIVPSTRGYQPFVQSWGGGPSLMGGVHEGTCCFNIKQIQYYEQPLDYVHIYHKYITEIMPNFNIYGCGGPCVEDFNLLRSIDISATPTNTPTPTVTPTVTVTPGLTPTATSTLTPTPTPTVTITPSITPTHTVTPGLTPTATPTPTTTNVVGSCTGIRYNLLSTPITQPSDTNNSIVFLDISGDVTYDPNSFDTCLFGMIDAYGTNQETYFNNLENTIYFVTFCQDSISVTYSGDPSGVDIVSESGVTYVTFYAPDLNLTSGSVSNFRTGLPVFVSFTYTPLPTETPTATPTSTPTNTPTSTITPTPSVTQGLTPTATPTNTITPTVSVSSTVTPTPTITVTSTHTNTPTPTISHTPTPTSTLGVSATPTPTATLGMTPTPTTTPTPTGFGSIPSSGFTFDFDYMVVEYFFTDGLDTDTITYISNPSIMLSNSGDSNAVQVTGGNYYDYVGTCAGPSMDTYPYTGTPYLIYGGDNHGTGAEAVLFDLNQFKIQNPSSHNIEITFTSTFYSQVGVNPVFLKATLWKGGTPEADGYTFINTSATDTFFVESTGTTMNLFTQNCVPFQEMGKFEFNTLTYNGYFVYPPNPTILIHNDTNASGIVVTGLTISGATQVLDFNAFPLNANNYGGLYSHPSVTGTGSDVINILFDNSSGNLFDVIVTKNNIVTISEISLNQDTLSLTGLSLNANDVIVISVYDKGGEPTPTPTTIAVTSTPTPTISITPTHSFTPTVSVTSTPTPSSSAVVITPTTTPTVTVTPTHTNTPTPSITLSNTPTHTPSSTMTATPTVSVTNTPTHSVTPTPTQTMPTPTPTPTFVCYTINFDIINNTSQVIQGMSYLGQNITTHVSGNTYSGIVNGGSGRYSYYFSNNSTEPFYIYFTYPFNTGVYVHVTDSLGNTYCTTGGGGSQTSRIDIYGTCSGPITITINNTPC